MSAARSDESTASRYVVGFDLGTTNSAVCYVDTEEEPWRVRTFRVPQLVAPGQVEARESLPSFLYQPAPGELPADALRLPWHGEDPTHAVGFFARDHGATVPGRLIVSAKSWLCHSGVDRTAPVLPWHGAADAERLSPVDVSARYLEHVRGAWDARFRELCGVFHEEQPMTLLVHSQVGVLVDDRYEEAEPLPVGMRPFTTWVPADRQKR